VSWRRLGVLKAEGARRCRGAAAEDWCSPDLEQELLPDGPWQPPSSLCH
jgi:hypothetical protein